MENDFNELKRLFDAQVGVMMEKGSDEREVEAQVLLSLLDGYTVREAERILITASRLAGSTSVINTGGVPPLDIR